MGSEDHSRRPGDPPAVAGGAPARAVRRARARRERQLRRRRLGLALGTVIVAVVAGIIVFGAGGSSSGRGASGRPPSRGSAGAVRVAVIGALRTAVQFPAASALPDGRVVLLGGLVSGDVSTATITTLRDGREVGHGQLPVAQHDAGAATLGGAVYVFGGGALQSFDHILRFDPVGGHVTQVGRLPQPASDVAVAAIGDTAYVVGGYNDASPLDTIVAWSPGRPARVVGHLPEAVRYPAVAAVGGKLVIAGGSLASGASRSVAAFDPAAGVVKRIGTLPAPVAHASAATLAATVFVVGGRRSATSTATQTADVVAIDFPTGRARRVGRLPAPVSDAAVVASGGSLVIAGGRSPTAPVARISRLELTGTGR